MGATCSLLALLASSDEGVQDCQSEDLLIGFAAILKFSLAMTLPLAAARLVAVSANREESTDSSQRLLDSSRS